MQLQRDQGLGFDFDWSGLATSVVNAGASYALARNKLQAQTALAKAQLSAQYAGQQQGALASQASYGGPWAPPTGADLRRYLPGAPSASWVVPALLAGVLVGGVVLHLRRGRRRA